MITVNDLSYLTADPGSNKLWLAPESDDGARLRYLTIGSADDEQELETGDVLLDHAIEQLIPVTSGDRKRLVVEHSSEVGFLTILDAEQPEAGTAVSLKGFFLADVLVDRGE